ncbi:hypothetical protein FRB94_001731 [Tulasnella sp. JGI-2019a]|nr:hypothetical protein FRB93_007223 [Tulasnella sp. JGI-2019a]KAG9013626.1 hypothetical protein FRB94_001731 [Tulasnella sp. JGI-2019a]KAG9035136.1 hypothetical protein FRB95_012003 [Tulasnella sp. JGI-2019a]
MSVPNEKIGDNHSDDKHDDEEIQHTAPILHAHRTIAFPDDEIKEDKDHAPVWIRPKGPEMRRELTMDEKELANAGYEHLEADKAAKPKPGEKDFEKVDITEHRLGFEQLSTELHANIDTVNPSKSQGLTTAEAAARLARDGPNCLTPPKKKSAFRKYLDCLTTLFNIILIFSGILEYILLGVQFHENIQNTYLGGILIAVAFLNAFIEFYQLQKSEAILASFLAMIPPACRAIRDGELRTVPAADLVKGDVVLVRMGDKTPADMILFAGTDLKVDNSSLTGESEPVERDPQPNGSKHPRAVEAENLIFNSTLCVSGEAYGIVVRTGDKTLIGQIAALTGGESGNQSPLGREIHDFVIMVSSIAIIFAVVFFVVGITTAYKGQAAATVTFAVSILVAFVPEGLPSVVTLLLSIAAKRMAAQNVLVKDLQGVETLGSLTLLATDKTGTLTRNQMTVTNLWSGGKMYTAFKSNNDDDDTEKFALNGSGMTEMVDIAALNSRVKFDKQDVPFEQREILGDATETGLARFAGKQLDSYDDHQAAHPKVFEVPFNSTNKWALVIVDKEHSDGSLTSYIKGAPERVLSKCSTYLQDGKAVPVTEAFSTSYDNAYNYMASRGHRVIACAQALLPGDRYPKGHKFHKGDGGYPISDYCFVGLVSLEDPPKHGVREAIGTLRLAGIKVMMVTGDHPKTAEAIARKINLVIGDTKQTLSARTGRPIDQIYEDEVQAVVIHGDDIDKLQGWEWDNIFNKEEIVFARTSPQHKLEIVKRAQALGHIVGVTGDGVNDSPALKKADLGIAMNISGSDVSKEAANMILLDDNFASTVHGVQEGRQIFINLKRSIQYTISHTTPEVIPQLLYVVVPIPLPLSAILILVIDLGFELFVGLSFAWDPPETKDGVMRMNPRRPVNAKSINALKKRALRRTKTIRRDTLTEGQAPRPPTKLAKFIASARAPFTRQYWADKFEDVDYEKLVDSKVLSYAYLEAGMIEFLAGIISYFVVFYKNGFSPNDLKKAQSNSNYFKHGSPVFVNGRGQSISSGDQLKALGEAQSIVYLSIFICQCFNVFAVKAKFTFPFGKQVIGNKWNFGGLFAGGCLGMFIIYTPPLHVVFGGNYHLSPLYWLISVAFGCLLLVWSSIRVILMRRGLQLARVKDITGLMMFPTMRTMSLRQTA